MRFIWLLLLAQIIVSCGRQAEATTENSNDAAHAKALKVLRVLAASKDSNSVSSTVESYGKRIADLEYNLSIQKMMLKEVFDAVYEDRAVEIDAFRQSFTPAPTTAGILFVSCEGAEPYLTGHKIKLSIGNPLVAAITRASVEFRYGKKKPSSAELFADRITTKDYFEMEKRHDESRKTNVTEIAQSLLPGQWNRVEITLNPCLAEELAFVQLKITVHQVSLKEGKSP
jgi:hypothetical protein